MNNRPILVCSDAGIQNAEAQIKANANQRELAFQKRDVVNANMARVAVPLQQQNQIISNFDSQISSISAQVSLLNMRNVVDNIDHHHGSDRHRSTFGEVVHIVQDVSVQMQIASLNQQIIRLEAERAPYVSQRDALQREYDYHNSQLNAAVGEIQSLDSHDKGLREYINTSVIFLDKLVKDPQALCQTFESVVTRDLANYKHQHPADMSETVRIVLRELPEKMKGIFESVNLPLEHIDENRKWQIKYALLCQLMWEMHNKLLSQELELNQNFLSLLQQIMFYQVHIAKGGDLPDRVAPLQNNQVMYEAFKMKHPQQMRDMNSHDLQEIEFKEYFQARIALQNTIGTEDSPNVPSQVYRVASAALKNAEDLRIKEVEKPVPTYFYTTALNQLNKTILQPSSENIQECRRLASVAHGVPSCGKIFGGILLLAASAIFTTACLFIAMASFGVAAPASALGICLGTSMAVQALSTLGFVGGVTGMAFGIGLFQRKSLSRDLGSMGDVLPTVNNGNVGLPPAPSLPPQLQYVPINQAGAPPSYDVAMGQASAPKSPARAKPSSLWQVEGATTGGTAASSVKVSPRNVGVVPSAPELDPGTEGYVALRAR